MKIKWFVVVNRVRARIFRVRPFKLLKVFENPLGREKNKVLRTDKPGWGRSQFKGACGIHAMDGEKDPHEEAALQFARALCRYLEQQANTNEFEDLVVAAEPKMLGRVRSQMDKHLAEDCSWMQKDLAHMGTIEIGETVAHV